MLFALERHDRHVVVMTMLPIAVDDRDGKRYRVSKVEGMKVPGQIEIMATLGDAVLKLTWQGHLRQLDANSIEGYTLIFPTVQDEMAKHSDKYVANHRVTEVPADRTYRNAWAMDGGRIGHAMDKARELHRTMMREARAPLLADLDVAYQRADEAEDVGAKRVIAARKKVLRDITELPEIEQAVSVEELKLIWPLGTVGAP